jgi:hypothetical protein
MFRELNEEVKRGHGRLRATGESMLCYLGVSGLTIVLFGGLYLAILLLE